MAGSKPFRGIEFNECRFLGTVVADPVAQEGFTFLTLRTSHRQPDANGQWVDVDQDVPLMIEPGSRLHNTVSQYVATGRQLHVKCHYKSWDAGGVLQHAMVVDSMDLGTKPYEGPAGG